MSWSDPDSQIGEKSRLAFDVAADLVTLLDQQKGLANPIFRQAEVIDGLFTEPELREFHMRMKVRERLLTEIRAGTKTERLIPKVVKELNTSYKLVKRCLAAITDEYPPILPAPGNIKLAIPDELKGGKQIEKIFEAAGYEVVEGQLINVADSKPIFPVVRIRGEEILLDMQAGEAQIACFGNDKIAETMAGSAKAPKIDVLARFDENKFRLSLAVPKDKQAEAERDLPAFFQGSTISTSYPAILKSWLKANGITARTQKLAGKVEQAVKKFGSKGIFEIVFSGKSLEDNGLVAVGAPVVVGSVDVFALKTIRNSMTPEDRQRVDIFIERLKKSAANSACQPAVAA